MERKINRRQQGDLGEASAIEWLTSVGANLFLPFGHSPDADLIAAVQGRLLRVQVKTSTQSASTPDGHPRWPLALATRGGNQSWNRVIKKFDPARFDYLFALTGGGRRWFIPSIALEGQTGVSLGGPKYSEYEIDPGRVIYDLVYETAPPLKSPPPSGEYPRGQRMPAVNRSPLCFAGSTPASPIDPLPPPPFRDRPGFQPSRYDRKLGRRGEAMINQKRRVTIPRQACLEAGLQDGDRVFARCHGDGRIVLERIEPPPEPEQL